MDQVTFFPDACKQRETIAFLNNFSRSMYFLFQVSLLTYFVNLNWTLQGHLDGPDDCFMLTSEGIVMNFKFVMWNQQLQSK